MSEMLDVDLARRSVALQTLAQQCRLHMLQRWPRIDFYADVWPIRMLYQTRMLDVKFHVVINDFADRDGSYLLACRCLVSIAALKGDLKNPRGLMNAWRLLCKQTVPFMALRRHHLSELEDAVVNAVPPSAAGETLQHMSKLSRLLDDLARLGVIDNLVWSLSAKNKVLLTKLKAQRSKVFKARKAEVLDRQIEGLSEATKAMLQGDDRLSAVDRSGIAVANILMCAPSRINEPLCMRINDRFNIADYANRPNTDYSGELFQAHQLLLMKGSKGADWSGKPILNFMIGLSDLCWKVIIAAGARSRMLLKHYEQNPDRLYLPPELERLRGKPVTKRSLWHITQLTNQEPTQRDLAGVTSGSWKTTINRRKDKGTVEVLEVDNPYPFRSDGSKSGNSKIPALPWDDVEASMLERVGERMARMRWVTPTMFYDGPLSEMLTLVDVKSTPYLPQAWEIEMLGSRLKTPQWRRNARKRRSVFSKLGLQMTQCGRLVSCYIEPHDIRRWLTTQALQARERLSDVLINKWANRLCVAELAAYDLRTDDQKAQQAAIPIPHELESITSGLKALEEIENEYGLSTAVVVAHGDERMVTSLEAVCQATENRPVARSGNQVIILYPTRFGVCLHQHHEMPCRAYECVGCNEQVVVKGHLPSNDEWRKEDRLITLSIVNQLQTLITARNRGVADDPEMLDSHLLYLVKGLELRTMADELITRFHEIKDQIRDLYFRNELEQAFVARGVTQRLDDCGIESGDLIRYHNPSRHASPGYERAIERQLGGRREMEKQDEVFYRQYPELAPDALNLHDERYLLESDDSDAEDEGEQAA